MCGLAGGITNDIAPFLKHALARLEYRGYDSWGCSVPEWDDFRLHHELGAPSASRFEIPSGHYGLGHTRWATHGQVSLRNTHPVYSRGWVAVCNGVVENYRDVLGGHPRATDTDTEAIAFAVADEVGRTGVCRPILRVLRSAMGRLSGRYAFAAMESQVGRILLATTGSPLVVAPEEKLFASDVQALAGFAKKAYAVKPGYCLVMSEEGIESLPDDDWRGNEIAVPEPDWTAASRDCPGPAKVRGEWMLREMMEQPGLIRHFVPQGVWSILDCHELCLYGVGSSLHAAMLGQRFLLAVDINCSVAHALDGVDANFREDGRTYLAITQSGESKVVLDEMACNIGCDPEQHHAVLTNRPESSAARLCGIDEVRFMGGGPERAVAATKSFTMTAMHLWGLTGDEYLTPENMSLLADAAEIILRTEDVIQPTFIAGDGPEYALALEGALKFKEVAYLHTEGVRLSDTQHGPLAMLCPEDAVLVLALDEPDMTRLEELHARGIGLAVVCAEDLKEEFFFAQAIYVLPNLPWQARMILTGILLQKLAYNAAMHLHTDDPDMPRHLAKSVTV